MLSNTDDLTLLLSLAVFAAAGALFLFGALVFLPAMQTRRLVTDSLVGDGPVDRRSILGQDSLAKAAAQRLIEAYFKSMEKERNEPDALEAKLFRAGFYSASAPLIYTLCRLGAVAIGFLLTYALLSKALPPRVPGFLSFAGAGLIGLGCIVIPSIMLDRFENKQKQIYRRAFPDFMDMMITCADAGMRLEAAVERVSQELAG
ncbi:MAG: type II secretion system F family protein, partial [Alphaproteobacteria bacterium]|nr:type II secretion system F family protein [Alphaproteobacteria bacterium]